MRWSCWLEYGSSIAGADMDVVLTQMAYDWQVSTVDKAQTRTPARGHQAVCICTMLVPTLHMIVAFYAVINAKGETLCCLMS